MISRTIVMVYGLRFTSRVQRVVAAVDSVCVLVICCNIVHMDLLEDAAAVHCLYLPYRRRYILI